jgi:hypothetical protein
MVKGDFKDIIDTLNPDMTIRHIPQLNMAFRKITDMDSVYASLTPQDRINIAKMNAISIGSSANSVITNHETFIDHFIQGLVIASVTGYENVDEDPFLRESSFKAFLMGKLIEGGMKRAGVYENDNPIISLSKDLIVRLTDSPEPLEDPLLLRYAAGANLMPKPIEAWMKNLGCLKVYRDGAGGLTFLKAVIQRLLEDPKHPFWGVLGSGRSNNGFTPMPNPFLLKPSFKVEGSYITPISISWESHPDMYAKSLTQRVRAINTPGSDLEKSDLEAMTTSSRRILRVQGQAVDAFKGFGYLANELSHYFAFALNNGPAKCDVTVQEPILVSDLIEQGYNLRTAGPVIRDRVIDGYKLFFKNLKDYAASRIVGNGIPIGEYESRKRAFAPELTEILDSLPNDILVDISHDAVEATSQILGSLEEPDYKTRIAQRFTRLVIPSHTQYGANRVSEIIEHHKS